MGGGRREERGRGTEWLPLSVQVGWNVNSRGGNKMVLFPLLQLMVLQVRLL